jgi:predicted Ser/Thr protein kinase
LTLIQPLDVLCPWIKAYWPEWFLPPTVILKKQKDSWEDEFETEKEAYNLLKPIQGTIVLYFYGEAVYDRSRALIFSAITGSNLFYLARNKHNKFPESKDEALKRSLEDAFKALTSYGVEYGDQKLDNFMWVDERVMVIDLENVKFDTTDVWEENVNSATADSLMREFMRTRDPGRMSSYRRRLLSGDPLY